jgi:tRNA-dependent cyclodipeptide synthase
VSASGGRAFVGVSLDSRLFTREWLRLALPHLLEQHDEVLVVLADDLLQYTRSASLVDGRVVLQLEAAASAAGERRAESLRSIERALVNLSASDRTRIAVKVWSDFEDRQFAALWRAVQIACGVIVPFRTLVRDIAARHVAQTPAAAVPNALEASVAFILDEIAMCLRITEVAGWSFEYHPASDLPALGELYADQFRPYGLTVESLTGAVRRRRFHVLDVADLTPSAGIRADPDARRAARG